MAESNGQIASTTVPQWPLEWTYNTFLSSGHVPVQHPDCWSCALVKTSVPLLLLLQYHAWQSTMQPEYSVLKQENTAS